MKLKRYSDPPCGFNFPRAVLKGSEGEPDALINIMEAGLSLDRKTLHLIDAVDNYYTCDLNKAGALELADYFRGLAENMKD